MLITLSRCTSICQSFAEVCLIGCGSLGSCKPHVYFFLVQICWSLALTHVQERRIHSREVDPLAPVIARCKRYGIVNERCCEWEMCPRPAGSIHLCGLITPCLCYLCGLPRIRMSLSLSLSLLVLQFFVLF